MKPINQSFSVYESLKAKIEHGDLPSGANLKEIELSKEYLVSRNTVKKALLMLERDTLVSIEPNKGAKVRSYSLEEVLDFLEIRSVLEGFIVRTACIQISDSQLKEMENVLAGMKQDRRNEDLIAYSAKNKVFHGIIYEACPNRTATKLLISLVSQMKKYNTKTILIPGRRDQSLAEHQAIFDALSRHCCDQAESLMTEHIINIRHVFKSNHQLLL